MVQADRFYLEDEALCFSHWQDIETLDPVVLHFGGLSGPGFDCDWGELLDLPRYPVGQQVALPAECMGNKGEWAEILMLDIVGIDIIAVTRGKGDVQTQLFHYCKRP